MNILKKIWDNFEEFFQVIIFIAILITVFIQVVSRIINRPLMFTEELARYLFLWLIMLGFGFATKHEIHLKLEVLPKFTPAFEHVSYIVMQMVGLIVSIYMIKVSIPYLEFSKTNLAPALEIPMNVVYSCMPIGFAINCIRHIELICKRIIKITNRKDTAKEATITGGKEGTA